MPSNRLSAEKKNQAEASEQPVEEKETGPKGKNKVRIIDTKKWPPYDGKASLEKDYKISKKGKIMSRGSARYALHMTDKGTYKLLAYFRNGKGVGTMLVKVIRPNKKTAKSLRDKAFLNELKANGIPVLTD